METLKTALAALLLLAVLYGAYVVLHKPGEAATCLIPADSPNPAEGGSTSNAEMSVDAHLRRKEPSTIVNAYSIDRASAFKLPGDVFEETWQIALSEIVNERWYDALSVLSRLYNSPDVSDLQRRQLLDLLDPVAGKVVYSDEHLIEEAYEVQPGDTLSRIARWYNVPSQLLANINGIDRTKQLAPGNILKVVPGPFRAEVDTSHDEVTIFMGDLYAGRFPLVVVADLGLSPGEYCLTGGEPGSTQQPDRSSGQGRIHLQCKQDPSRYSGALTEDNLFPWIALSPIDANDVRTILSKDSTVLIRR